MCLLFFVALNQNLNLATKFIKNYQYIILRKIRPMEFECHAERQTDGPEDMTTLAVIFLNCERF